MKRLMNYFLVTMLIPAFVLTSCKDKQVEKGTYADLSSYMVANNLDLPALLDGWIIDPKLTSEDGGIVDPTDFSIPDWTVFDIRSAADFALGHVKGSVNTTLGNILTEANAINNNEAKILVVCYSGQTAGRAVMALRLSGFPNAKVMKFGFSVWSDNPDFDKWSSKTANIADNNANWVATAAPTIPVNTFPTWKSTATEGEAILKERIDLMLGDSEWGIAAATVLGVPADFSIYNFWTLEDYTTFGHYTGAYQYNPIKLADDIILGLDPDNNSLIYCYTGQTSSFTVAWLNVLGYKSQSIYNGVNALRYNALSDAGKPHWHFPYHSYGYETGK